MAYREAWVIEILNGRSVLQCALDVHMTTNGSTERSEVSQIADIKALREVESMWTHHGICDFDDAVLAVVQAAISEAASGKAS